jgi:thymidylate synthase
MRSSDAIWGLGCDINMFSFIYEIVYNKLLLVYEDLEIGIYHQRADSLHIYEKHFKMVETILSNGGKNYYEIECPKLFDYSEAIFLRNNFPKIEEDIRKNVYNSQIVKIDENYKLTQFMINELMKRWYK